jgi:anti-sigma B factor antagonist
MLDPGPESVETTRLISLPVPTGRPEGFTCLRHETNDGAIRFALSGELDIATAPELEQALQTAQHHARPITLDLRHLNFMDCRALTVILTAARRANAAGTDFRIVRGPPHVHRLFELTRTDTQLQITSTSDAPPPTEEATP